MTLILWLLSRTRWQPSAPLHLARRRGFGQIVFSTGRLYGRVPWVFIHITALLVPIPILITGSSVLVNYGTESSPGLETLGVIAAVVGVVLDLLALALVQVVVALAMERVDAGQDVTFMELFRATRAVAWKAIRAWLLYVVIAALLARHDRRHPDRAVAGRALGDVTAGDRPGRTRRARRVSAKRATRPGLTSDQDRRHRVCSARFLPEFLGPLAGALIIFALGVSFELANFVSTLAFLCLLPFAAAMRMYLYHDLRVRDSQRAPEHETGGVLPPELITESH